MPSFFDRERTALVRLTEAIRLRASAEAELAAAFQTGSDKAEREVNRARKTIGTARETELTALDHTHGTAIRELAGQLDAEIFTLNRAREEKRTATVQRFKAAEEKGQSEYKDRLWSLDSILEGGEKKAKDHLELLHRKAAVGEAEVEELWKEAEPPLSRCRVKRSDVAFVGVTRGQPESDPITEMQTAIEVGERSLHTLKSLTLPKFAKLGGLFLCVVLMAGVGASSFAFLEPEPAIAMTAGTGLILGLGLWFLLRSLAHKATLKAGTELGKKLDMAVVESPTARGQQPLENDP